MPSLFRATTPRSIIAGFAVPLLLFAACHSTRTTYPTPRFDGATLYRGLILGYGPAARAVPEIRDNFRIDLFVKDQSQLRHLITGYDRVVREMQVVDRSFFGRFERAMTSGDELAVQQGLLEAGKITVEAVRRLPEFRRGVDALRQNPEPLTDAVSRYNAEVRPENRFERGQIDEMIAVLSSDRPVEMRFGISFAAFVFTVAWVVAAVDFAVVSSVAAAVAVWLALGVERYVAGPSWMVANRGDVFREQLIHSIAVNLRAPETTGASRG